MEINDVLIRDTKTLKVIDGTPTVLQPGHVYVNGERRSTEDATSDTQKNIQIIQDAFSDNAYDFSAAFKSNAPPMKDIYIKRNIINESGDVLIDNREGGISSSGQILAKNVDIKAIGDFTQVVDDWLHTNKDPNNTLTSHEATSSIMKVIPRRKVILSVK